MLAGKQGGRRDNCDLLAVHCGDERCAQGDLRLAETDIAANEAVHRAAAFQITQNIGDCRFLIVSFFPWEAVDELVVVCAVSAEYRRFAKRACRSSPHQFACDFADAIL